MSEAKVYAAIAAATADLSREGVGKTRKNQQQGYAFRSIDDVLNALSTVLPAHKLAVLPRVIDLTQGERATAKGGVLFTAVVTIEYDVVSAEDGSSHTVRMIGEGMDSADKAIAKAASAAYKSAMLQTFCIPVEGQGEDRDADYTTPQPTAAPKPAPAPAARPLAAVPDERAQLRQRIAQIAASDRYSPGLRHDADEVVSGRAQVTLAQVKALVARADAEDAGGLRDDGDDIEQELAF